LEVLLGQTRGTYSLNSGPLLVGHTQHMSTWWDGTLFIVLSQVLTTSRLKNFGDNPFGIRSKLLQQCGICRSDLLDQRLRHLRVLSHDLTHIGQLTRGKLGHSSTASTTKPARVLLPLLLLLLGKLEEVSGSGLLDRLLNRGRVGGGLLRLGLSRRLSRRWRNQLGLNMSGNALMRDQ